MWSGESCRGGESDAVRGRRVSSHREAEWCSPKSAGRVVDGTMEGVTVPRQWRKSSQAIVQSGVRMGGKLVISCIGGYVVACAVSFVIPRRNMDVS
jgi:hypothetical protein